MMNEIMAFSSPAKNYIDKQGYDTFEKVHKDGRIYCDQFSKV